MTARSEWMGCRQLTRREFRESGGCFWDVKPDSPGYSLRIPNGTAFLIHLEGPQSHKFVHGECRDGKWLVTQGGGPCAYDSANKAVHEARKHIAKRTDAYLYISFKVDERFIVADELRHSAEFGTPPEQDAALKSVKHMMRSAYPKLSPKEAEIRAEEYLEEHPEVFQEWRDLLS